MTGRIVALDWITREMLRADPEARFVFGDNTERVGLGGQAASMRGEPNAIGVATKWSPGMRDHDFFRDNDVLIKVCVDADIDLVAAALEEGRTVYVPRDGLGTGLSELPKRAPKLHAHIISRFHEMAGNTLPWS